MSEGMGGRREGGEAYEIKVGREREEGREGERERGSTIGIQPTKVFAQQAQRKEFICGQAMLWVV